MSTINETLEKKTIQAWRDFASTPQFDRGLDYLRHVHAPRPGGADEVELVKSAIGWSAYMEALRDVENVLTNIPPVEKQAEEPGLEPVGR